MSAKLFDVVIDLTPEAVTLSLTGELEACHADAFAEAIERAVEAEPLRIVVNCEALTFVDSAGLRYLLLAKRRLNDSGKRLLLERPCPTLRRLLDVTGLTDELAVLDG